MEIRDKLQNLLNQLHKVQSRGRDYYVACCPAHADKNPSLAVKLDGEKILIKCWSGCDAQSILNAVGLDFEDVFPDREIYRQSGSERPTLSSSDALRIVKNEARIIWMMANDIKNKKEIQIGRAHV